MSLTSDILKRFREHGYDIPGPDENWKIQRTYAGHWQRSAGAWSWSLRWVGDEQCLDHNSYGGFWAATLCVREGCTVADERYGIVLEPPGV